MPSYDYYCPANGQTLEVQHRMSEKLTSWGQLADLAGVPLGEVAAEAPVERRIRASGAVVGAGALKNPDAPACFSGGCCGGGACHH